MSTSPRRLTLLATLAGVTAIALVLPAAASRASTLSSATGVGSTATVAVAPAASGSASGEIEPAARGVVGFGDQSGGERVGRVLYDSRRNAPLKAGETRVLDVLGSTGPVPAGATAVILTVTAVDMERSGWLTVWGGGATRPTASTLNFTPGTPVPNTALVSLGVSRTLRVMNGSSGTTQVLLSFQGYVLEDGSQVRPGSLRPVPPTRVVDTRAAATPVPANGYRDIRVPGSVASAGARAAVLDVIAVKPTRAGHLIAHAPGTARPTTTTVTYRVGSDRAALTVVPLSSTGTVRVWNMSSAPVHLVVDGFGWVAGGSGATTLAGLDVAAPTRVLDTRQTAAGAITGYQPRALPATPGATSGTVFSITVTGGTRPGYLRYGVWANPYRWSGSFLNYAAGETVTATVVVPRSPHPDHDVVLQAVTSGRVHVVVDRLATVAPRAEVTGAVRDVSTGDAVPHALVSVDGPTGFSPTQPDGTFRRVPVAPGSVQVCGATGEWTGTTVDRDGRYATGCGGGLTDAVPQQSIPLGARLVDADVALEPTAVLTGRVVGPTPDSEVFGQLTIERVDAPGDVFGTQFNGTDGRWRAIVPPGRYIVSTDYGVLVGTTSYLANEVATGLPRIPRATEPTTTRDELVAAGATVFDAEPTQTVTVPTLTLLVPGRIKPTIVDPDGDLSDVSIRYVHRPSGYGVWGYPVGSPPSWLTASIPLRPGSYAVCVTEGATTTCNDGSSTPQAAAPVAVTPGDTTAVTLTLP